MIGRLIEWFTKTISDPRGPAVLLLLTGSAFMLLAFFDVSTSAISSKESGVIPAAVIGGSIFVGGVILVVLDRMDDRQDVKTIVFYAPTFQANSFFASLLDQTVVLTQKHGYRLVVERGDDPSGSYHDATNAVDVIKHYSLPDHVILMVPPNPEAFESTIWALNDADDANLITLDMGFDDRDQRFRAAKFHKRGIVVDNDIGCSKAAGELLKYCRDTSTNDVNLIVCEGSIHERGKKFREAIDREAAKQGLSINYLGSSDDRLDFSMAIAQANQYLTRLLQKNEHQLTERPTFVFCANDNLTIGARMAASSFASRSKLDLERIRLICFDASVFITAHIDLADMFIWCAVDQRYREIVRLAIQSAGMLFEGEDPPKEVTSVQPSIYRSGGGE